MELRPKMILNGLLLGLAGLIGMIAGQVEAKDNEEQMMKHLEENYIMVPKKKKKGEQ